MTDYSKQPSPLPLDKRSQTADGISELGYVPFTSITPYDDMSLSLHQTLTIPSCSSTSSFFSAPTTRPLIPVTTHVVPDERSSNNTEEYEFGEQRTSFTSTAADTETGGRRLSGGSRSSSWEQEEEDDTSMARKREQGEGNIIYGDREHSVLSVGLMPKISSGSKRSNSSAASVKRRRPTPYPWGVCFYTIMIELHDI
eukprot:GHVS01030550.1.p1 GENE.GHVS01030550.1~~GHVS01030550.1.p1  ORF type:complete len:198 (-),score=38.76 GHVS01030550.1:1344-1937(-)